MGAGTPEGLIMIGLITLLGSLVLCYFQLGHRLEANLHDSSWSARGLQSILWFQLVTVVRQDNQSWIKQTR